ncbi:hypothetical protein R3P38DRAFT_2775748 [Favolaschia claudopus]|uniref:Uncharacterized protein n=1 Tax=Favolaschia claudopus TaxID=2862362 RepID=A0AAW0BQL2_9AGAR
MQPREAQSARDGRSSLEVERLANEPNAAYFESGGPDISAFLQRVPSSTRKSSRCIQPRADPEIFSTATSRLPLTADPMVDVEILPPLTLENSKVDGNAMVLGGEVRWKLVGSSSVDGINVWEPLKSCASGENGHQWVASDVLLS